MKEFLFGLGLVLISPLFLLAIPIFMIYCLGDAVLHPEKYPDPH